MQTRPKHTLAAWAVVALFAAGAASVQAGVIAFDDFETYGTGQFENGVGVVASGGSGSWTGTWNVDDARRDRLAVVTRALTFDAGTVHVSGGTQALRLQPNADMDAFLSRTLPAQTGTLYLSFLLQAPTITQTTGGNDTNDFLQFGFHTSANSPAISAGIADSSGGQRFFARTTTNSVFGTTQVDPAATYFVVLKISGSAGGYGRADLFVNPTSDVEAAQTPITRSNGSNVVTNPTALDFRLYRHEPLDEYYIDRVTIGSTFADVVPTAIPEPATGLLLGAGLLLAFRRGRR